MKKIILLSYILLISIVISAQTEKFSKKTWKAFNASFEQNLNAAKEFYNGNIDYENRNEDNGFPTSKIKMPNASDTYLETAGYSSNNIYLFETAEEASAFLKSLQSNLKLPKLYKVIEDDGFIRIVSENEEGMNPTVDIEVNEKEVYVYFSPPLDVSIPFDIK